MRNGNWLLSVAAGLALAAAALADNPTTTPPPEPPDPPGTTLYMDKLRALFAAWDLNADKNLDKAELAKAFRGAEAKPYDYVKDSAADAPKEPAKDPAADPAKDPSKDTTTAKKPDYSKYPDYEFLVQLDADGDGQISRAEFMTWARDYAVQLKQQVDQETKVAALEAKMANATSAKEIKKLEKELKKEQASLTKVDSAMIKAVQVQLKHHK